MENVIAYNRKKYYRSLWILPISIVIFLLSSVTVYAYLTGYNSESVGQAIYTIFSVGQTSYGSFVVGGYSTNQASNSMAQNVLPAVAVVIVIMYAFKNMSQDTGFEGFLRTTLIIVIGAALLYNVVQILAALT
jgi:hypothetical protein